MRSPEIRQQPRETVIAFALNLHAHLLSTPRASIQGNWVRGNCSAEAIPNTQINLITLLRAEKFEIPIQTYKVLILCNICEIVYVI